MGKYVIKPTAAGFHFTLKAGNGEVIASSQSYKTLDGCRNGTQSILKNAPIAAVEDQTVEGYAEEKNPKFEIYKDKAEEFRFRLKAPNGEIIASSEGYKSKAGCKNGIESVRKNADSEVVELLNQ
ncbi:MAG: YegP family protein [Lachnospiraceae bacterium]|nr:YegP family protein [Lachnospiraceae bacterium]